jgi:hypothetical protein
MIGAFKLMIGGVRSLHGRVGLHYLGLSQDYALRLCRRQPAGPFR